MRGVAVLTILLLALALPAPTAADTPFASVVLRNRCTSDGGDAGHGFILLKVGAVEFGRSGANYLVFRARLQKRVKGDWVTRDQLKWRTDRFPNDDATWTWWYRAKWSFPRASHPPTRITMRVRFFDRRPGEDVVLATHRHVGKVC